MKRFAALMVFFAATAAAQNIAPMTADEIAAGETVTRRKVLSTISFLAADELGGRDTPSPGLTVATAYVAARFRGAGLRGLGPDGSFYLESRIKTYTNSSMGLSFRSAAGPIAGAYVLQASPKAFRYQGAVAAGTADGSFKSPVIVDEPAPQTATSRRRRSPWRQYTRRGATAIIVRARKDGTLLARARAAGSRLSMRRMRGAPIVVIPHDAKVEGEVTISVPAIVVAEAVVRNVAAILDGADPAKKAEAVIFSAHLDHIGRLPGAVDPINNGADDNASGCTAVMALADAFAHLKKRPARSAIFLTLWGEEKGLLGSRKFVENKRWPLDKIVANVNIEMVGRPEAGAKHKMWMTGWDRSDLGKIMDAGSSRAGVTCFEHKEFSAMLYRSSDNWPFAQKGVVAHSFSAGSLHDDYHKPGDHWEKLEIDHMTKVIQGLFAGSLPIVRGDATPTKAPSRRLP